MNIMDVVLLKQWANDNNVDNKRAQRLARSGKWPTTNNNHIPTKWGDNDNGRGGRWVINVNADVPHILTIPPTKRGNTTRTDGRTVHKIYLTQTEYEHITNAMPQCDVVSMRDIRKRLRATDKDNDND